MIENKNRGQQEAKQVGFFLYDDMDPLDFAGAFQVFASVNRIRPGAMQTFTFAFRLQPIRCANGLIITPESSFVDVMKIDLMIVPGGEGRRVPMANPMIQSQLRKLANQCEFIIGVSTGTLILAAAGILRDRQATTHWLALKELQERDDLIPYYSSKIVRAGRVLTCAGSSLAIDTSIYIIQETYGKHLADEVRSLIEHQHAKVPMTVF